MEKRLKSFVLFLFAIQLSLLFTGCGIYQKLENFQECQEFYVLSGKSDKTNSTIEAVVNSWEKDGFKVKKDTIYSNNGKYISPQIKVYGFQNSEIPHKINYINFVVHGMKNTTIQLHGVCLNEKRVDELSRKELQEIYTIIKAQLVDRFIK